MVKIIGKEKKVLMDIEKREKIALFRLGVIGDFVNQKCLDYGMKEKLLQFKSNCTWEIPYSKNTQISRSTILHWIRKYKNGGEKIKTLYPQKRGDIGKNRNIDKKTADIITSLTIGSNVSSVPELVKKIKVQCLIHPEFIPSKSTIYRFLHNNDLMIQLRNRKKSNIKSHGNIEVNEIWIQGLAQGEKGLNDLKLDLKGRLPFKDIEIMHECILNGPIRNRKRSLVVLSICKGIPKQTISSTLNIPLSTLHNNFKTYLEKGVTNIVTNVKNCTHVYENKEYIDKFFSILHAPPSTYGFNRTTWRQEDICQTMKDCGMPISRHALKKIIHNSGYKYRKAKTVLTSNDPEYKKKIREIQNILSNLKDNEKFFSIDEYGPFAIKMQGGKSLVPPGMTKTVPQWQKSKGRIVITAALELSTNQITHFYSERKNTTEMIKLLNILVKKYSEQECIYFSWDAASWHASKELQKRVDEINRSKYKGIMNLPRVKLAPLPTCAQFLNVIESVFSGMSRAIIHNSDYLSVGDAKLAIDRYFAERNNQFTKNPKRAGNKIWGKERVKPVFSESHNCKDPLYSR